MSQNNILWIQIGYETIYTSALWSFETSWCGKFTLWDKHMSLCGCLFNIHNDLVIHGNSFQKMLLQLDVCWEFLLCFCTWKFSVDYWSSSHKGKKNYFKDKIQIVKFSFKFSSDVVADFSNIWWIGSKMSQKYQNIVLFSKWAGKVNKQEMIMKKAADFFY